MFTHRREALKTMQQKERVPKRKFRRNLLCSGSGCSNFLGAIYLTKICYCICALHPATKFSVSLKRIAKWEAGNRREGIRVP